MLTDRRRGRAMVQTGWKRGGEGPAGRRGWSRRSVAGPIAIAALAVVGAACSPSAWVDETALPNPDARHIGLAFDAALTNPADLPTFDDGNGHGEVPAGGTYQL